jgi:ribonucleotide monophosphatase NagD (HAD superfamily)
VIEAGKPYPPIYDLAFARAEQSLGVRLDRRRVLAVGDGVATDLAGAKTQQLDVLFVADGVHAPEVLDASGRIDPEALERLIGDCKPAFVTRTLVW